MTGTPSTGVMLAFIARLCSVDNTNYIIHCFNESVHVYQGLKCYSDGG